MANEKINEFVDSAKKKAGSVGAKAGDAFEGVKAQIQPKAKKLSDVAKKHSDKIRNAVTNKVKGVTKKANSPEAVTPDSANSNPKRKKLDDKLRAAVTDYNAVYISIEDHGTKIFNQRERSVDLLR